MTATWFTALALWGLVGQGPALLQGQGSLERAVARAREMWMSHDMAGLLASSDTVRLQLPGVGRSVSLSPGQATRLLLRYVEGAEELSFELVGIRSASADHGYVEALRRYLVRGTRDEREETVFLGFRAVGGQWRLREVRVVP